MRQRSCWSRLVPIGGAAGIRLRACDMSKPKYLLHIAAAAGNTKKIEELISGGQPVDEFDGNRQA